jgi:hypothetical protein
MSDLLPLAGGIPEAMSLLRLAQTDVELQWDGPELHEQIRRRLLTRLLFDPAGRQMERYIDLREAVECWVAHSLTLRDDLTPDERDGEVLWTLARLLVADPCRPCFGWAYTVAMIPAAAGCDRHRELAAA